MFGSFVGFLVGWGFLCVWRVVGGCGFFVCFFVCYGVGRFFMTSCWRGIALRKYLKQASCQKQCPVPFLPLGLSIQASQVLDYPSASMAVVAPSPFRLFSSWLEPRVIEIPHLMHTSQTQKWKMCNFQVAICSSWLENNFSHAVKLPFC